MPTPQATSAPTPITWKASAPEAERGVLLDTGPLVALLTASDAHHRRCVDALASLSPPLLTCWQVLTEAAWLLRKQYRPLDRLAEAHAAGVFHILPLDGDSLVAIADIMRRHESIGLQFADAALVHLAERENIRTVFTTDRRDFSIVRLKRNRALKLIPDLQ
ncbi:type II toxin-antitoxin system VapC family toxin [Paludisphaera borealis]|uniref:type II toxin-antitoxin system VapC family toxin n=1 Tax=Paludisphaera borealis TaxID=1387353 RepID=UPI0035A267DD